MRTWKGIEESKFKAKFKSNYQEHLLSSLTLFVSQSAIYVWPRSWKCQGENDILSRANLSESWKVDNKGC